MKIDRDRFFQGYRQAFGSLTQVKVSGLNNLLAAMESEPLPLIQWRAYLLATTKHECADQWTPIAEYGKLPWFQQYEPDTKKGLILGNTLRGDGFLFRGRGYVQLTGRANYRRMGSLLKIDLESNPDLALVPDHAYQIAALGMVQGSFTGKKLGDYLGTDYKGARRVINGLDKADLIAQYAGKFELVLSASEVMTSPVAEVVTPNGDWRVEVQKAIDILTKALKA